MKFKPMRIAFLSIHSSPIGELGTKDTGGMSVYTRKVAQELGSRGHYVDIFTRRAGAVDTRIVDLYENVRLIHLNGANGRPKSKLELFPLLNDFAVELNAYRKKGRFKYDLLHSHYWLSGELGRLAQRLWDIPHMIHFHTLGAAKNTTEVGEKEPQIRLDVENQLVNDCQRVLAATELEKDQIVYYYGASPDKIGVSSCGVDLELFQPMSQVEARQRLGLTADESIILYVGRFDPIKGIDRLLEAMAHLTNPHRKRLVIVGGDGDHAPESLYLRDLSNRFGVQDRVTFIGRVRQDELPAYYSAADVLAVPSYYESFGLVGLESLACGTPLVATRVGAMDKIVHQGKTGCIVNDATPVSIARAIEAVVLKREDAWWSVEAIRSSVLNYSWTNVTSTIIDEYEKTIRENI